jgi:hypothetical protein
MFANTLMSARILALGFAKEHLFFRGINISHARKSVLVSTSGTSRGFPCPPGRSRRPPSHSKARGNTFESPYFDKDNLYVLTRLQEGPDDQRPSEERVFGPTTLSSPEMPCVLCHCLTSASVNGPYTPSAEFANPFAASCFCRSTTSCPRK